VISAFYLPLGLEEGLETTVQRFGPPHDAIEIHIPVVTRDDLSRWIEALREARATHLAERPAARIVRSLDQVTRRFLDRADPARREAVASLSRGGRFSAPMIERALDDAFQPLARGGLARWIASELGSIRALDRPFAAAGGIERRARGPEWMLHVYAGSVPTLPVWPIYAALVLKAALLAKTSAQEPILAPLLARVIAETDEALGACLAVVWWKGGAADLDRTALSLAPALLAFGGDEAIASVARQARPDAIRVLHGPKVSVGYVERRALHYAALPGLASRAALDVSLYDQQGCLSPHAFYVERKGPVPPARFAEALAAALEARALEMPRGEVTGSAAARVQLYRAQARFEAAAASDAGGGATQLLESPGGTVWTVVYEEGARFEPGPAYRTVRVHAVDGPEDFRRAVRASIRYLEAVALEARGSERGRLTGAFAAMGVPRIAAVGSLQRPSPLGTHGGLRRLLPFVSWTTVERAPKGASASRSSGRGSPRTARPRSR
jgi:hypothetical protein